MANGVSTAWDSIQTDELDEQSQTARVSRHVAKAKIEGIENELKRFKGDLLDKGVVKYTNAMKSLAKLLSEAQMKTITEVDIIAQATSVVEKHFTVWDGLVASIASMLHLSLETGDFDIEQAIADHDAYVGRLTEANEDELAVPVYAHIMAYCSNMQVLEENCGAVEYRSHVDSEYIYVDGYGTHGENLNTIQKVCGFVSTSTLARRISATYYDGHVKTLTESAINVAALNRINSVAPDKVIGKELEGKFELVVNASPKELHKMVISLPGLWLANL